MKLRSGVVDYWNLVPHSLGAAARPLLLDCMLALLGFIAIVTAPLLIFWAG